MIGNLESPTNDFVVLATYLLRGRDGPTHPDRVAWILEQNLGTDDPLLAAKIMTNTAEFSTRCPKACLHATINFETGVELPTPAEMQAMGLRFLDLFGLADHQVLMMGHGDKAHRHMHFMINRIHPETAKAFDLFQSHRRLDQVMRQLAEKFPSYRHHPMHAFHPEATAHLPKQPDSKSRYAAKRGANTNRPQWARKHAQLYGALVSDEIDRASSWDDLMTVFARDGYQLQHKGRGKRQGLIVAAPDSYTKFSALGLKSSAQSLTKRFGKPFPKHKATRPPSWSRRAAQAPFTKPWITELDLARAIGTQAAVTDAIQDIVKAKKARLAKKTFVEQLMEELKEQMKASTLLNPHARRSTPRRKTKPRPLCRDPDRAR